MVVKSILCFMGFKLGIAISWTLLLRDNTKVPRLKE